MFYTFYSSLISESVCLLRAGVPASNRARVRWAQGVNQLSLLAELQAGPEHLRAEYNGGKTEHKIPRWEYYTKLQHQVKALLERGLSSSVQAKTHYQVLLSSIFQATICLHTRSLPYIRFSSLY